MISPPTKMTNEIVSTTAPGIMPSNASSQLVRPSVNTGKKQRDEKDRAAEQNAEDPDDHYDFTDHRFPFEKIV